VSLGPMGLFRGSGWSPVSVRWGPGRRPRKEGSSTFIHALGVGAAAVVVVVELDRVVLPAANFADVIGTRWRLVVFDR
jgi:hypothetical protein